MLNRPMRLRAAASLAAAVLCCLAVSAGAQPWPAKPLRIVQATAPGGLGELFSRIVGETLSPGLGQPVMVVSRPGANGMIGTGEAARAAPDGYTLLLGTMSTHVLSPILHKPAYDPIKDFAPVSMLAVAPVVLVVNRNLPGNLPELIAYLRKNPGATFAHWGIGNISHLAGELFKSSTGVKMTHVPYTGSALARLDVIAGRVSVMFSDVLGMKDVQAGRLYGIGITNSQRSPAYPDLPTIAELGLPGYEAAGWFALYAPAGTPEPIIERLHSILAAAFAEGGLPKRIMSLGLDPGFSRPADVTARMKNDIAKWTKVIQEANLKTE